MKSGGFKGVDGAGGVDLYGDLLHGGNFAGIGAHEAVGFAVDANEAGEGLLGSGPVAGVLGSEVIGHRPDAEVGVVGDQGDGGRALLGESGRAGEDE